MRRLLLGVLAIALLVPEAAQAEPAVELKAAQRLQAPPLLTIERGSRAIGDWAEWNRRTGYNTGYLVAACESLSSRTVVCHLTEFGVEWDGQLGTFDWWPYATLRHGRIRLWSPMFEFPQTPR